MKVKQSLLKFISPSVPEDTRLKVAKLLEPKDPALAPDDQLTALFVLSHDASPEVSAAAEKSFAEYPMDIMISALDRRLDPLVLSKAARTYKDNEGVLTMIALNPGVDDETLKAIAENGPEEVIMILADERERLLKSPSLLDALKKNPLSPRSLMAELDAFVRSGGVESRAPAIKPVETPREFSAPDKDSPLEKAIKEAGDTHNIYQMVKEMSFGQKIKLALTGNKTAREFFAKDTNRLIVGAVMKNPRITEEEVLRLTTSKNTSDDVLRQIGHHKEWVKNYNIKLNLALNPKTPVNISLRLLDSLLEKDIVSLSKSKNVPSVLASTARRKVELKQKR